MTNFRPELQRLHKEVNDLRFNMVIDNNLSRPPRYNNVLLLLEYALRGLQDAEIVLGEIERSI